MTHFELNSFLDCQIKNVIDDGTMDALLALRVLKPGNTLFDIFHMVLRDGLESCIERYKDIPCSISHYVESAINPDLPW